MIKSQLIVIYLKWKLIVIINLLIISSHFNEEIEKKRGQAQKPSITYLCVLTLVFKCFKILTVPILEDFESLCEILKMELISSGAYAFIALSDEVEEFCKI